MRHRNRGDDETLGFRQRIWPRRLVSALGSIGFAAVLLAGVAHIRAAEADEDAAWKALRAGGHLALMRHATAPGVGDPAGFHLHDCATQRNLSDAGREEARLIGDWIREQGVAVDLVLTSEWCRCMETAKLLEVGPVQAFNALNSFFRQPEARKRQMAVLRPWTANAEPIENYVVVTHQVVVTELTGVFPQSGEIVVVRPRGDDGIKVVGRIPPP